MSAGNQPRSTVLGVCIVNIAFVHPSWPGAEGSGAVHSATRIIVGLADRGHDVTVYCPEHPPQGAVIDPAITLRTLDPSPYSFHPYLHATSALRERLDEFDAFDVTHSYETRVMPAIAEIGARTDTATVVTLNAYGGVCPKNDLRYMGREQCDSNGLVKCTACSLLSAADRPRYRIGRLFNLELIREHMNGPPSIDAFQALAPHIKSAYTEFGFPDDRIVVVNSVLDERFSVEHTSAFTEPYKLLYVGRLEESKGIDRLLPILDGVTRRSAKEFELTIVGHGKGDVQAQLERDAATYGLTEKVRFAGHVSYERLPSIYASHDFFVYPTRWREPFGRVFIEALAAGTPIVTTDHSGTRDVVGECGIFADSATDAFVERIVRTVEDEDLRGISRRSKRHTRNYHAENILPDIEAMYESVT